MLFRLISLISTMLRLLLICLILPPPPAPLEARTHARTRSFTHSFTPSHASAVSAGTAAGAGTGQLNALVSCRGSSRLLISVDNLSTAAKLSMSGPNAVNPSVVSALSIARCSGAS